MNYFGLDISDGMLEMATDFANTSIFNNYTTFNFHHNLDEIKQSTFDEIFRLSNVVILNFYYLFANLNLEQTIDLANRINILVEKYPLNKYIIIYQNPVNKHYNFSKFKNALKALIKLL